MTKTGDGLLPEPFHDLERFALDWSIERERDRQGRRLATSMADIRAFYEAMMPRMDAILTFLDPFPLDAMSDDARRLLWLTLSLAEIAPAIHFYREPRISDGFDPDRFRAFDVPNFTLPGERPAVSD